MLHPRHHALVNASKPACICPATSEVLTYGELDAAANQGAHLLRFLGVERGDVIAAILDNETSAFVLGWAAERAGVYLTSVSTRLSIADAVFIVQDAGAKLLVVSDGLKPFAQEMMKFLPDLRVFTSNGDGTDLPAWRASLLSFPAVAIEDECPGTDMLYSSGTTGRPKGVKPPLPTGMLGAETPLTILGRERYGMGEDMVYLSTSPLYHAAPLRWAMTVQRFGGTVILMQKFDAEAALEHVERYRVTHSTWVPTHFVRLLKLPEAVRARYDTSSQRAAIHSGAPCPVPVKRAMIDWWGPVLEEYYSGTETCGITALSTSEWLERPGSVGRPVLGKVHILDDEGNDVPAGVAGDVWFSDGPKFEYHNDPVKTAKAYNNRGWATLGDIGYVDEDGFLYLRDRRNFMIISGGVNIYPQEIENHLITHPKVADVAVVGAPDDEMGEIVVAVIQKAPGIEDEAGLAAELRDFARAGLGGVKTPKRFEFRDDLPREPTGKLMKAKLVEEFRNRDQAAA